MKYINGLYIATACNSFLAEEHKGVTYGNDYYVSTEGNFIDDNLKPREAVNFSWKKKKGYTYPEESVSVARPYLAAKPIPKASGDDFAEAEKEGMSTPKHKILQDGEVVTLATHVHQAPDPDRVPGITFANVNTGEIGEGMAEAVNDFVQNLTPKSLDGLNTVVQNLANPKEACGAVKAPYEFSPEAPIAMMHGVMAGGAFKYGPYNWRDSSVSATTYIGGIKRHLALWADGQDIDSESGIDHLAHIMAGCSILIDAKLQGTLIDNRNKSGTMEKVLADLAASHTAYLIKYKALECGLKKQ